MIEQKIVLQTRELRDLEGRTATRIESLTVNGMELQVPADSGFTLSAGPDPTTLTVTLIVTELSIEEKETSGG